MGTLMPSVPLLEPIRPEMERVECLLHDTLTDIEEPLGSMLRRLVGGGKRVRPAMAILIGRIFAVPSAPFHNLAAALDMLHAATLVHDDLIDEAPLRRGHKTLHTIWPAGATVLAGDYLLAKSIALIAELENPRLLKIFAAILSAMCAGEIRQMLVTREPHSRREEYYRGINAKTASLFAAAAEMAGVLAGAEEPQVAALRRFGREFGMAFQIVDDVLDFVGDEAQLGKPAGGDLRQGLITLPALYYLENEEAHAPVNAVLSGHRDDKHMRAAIQAVCASGAIEASLKEAHTHAQRSQAALEALPDNASRHLLCDLAEYVVARRW